MIAIYTQNRQAIWNFADISRFHVTGNGTGIQAVAKNGAAMRAAKLQTRITYTHEGAETEGHEPGCFTCGLKRKEDQMKKLIELDAAIDEIKAVYEWHDMPTEERMIQHFKALPSAQQWIPCDKGDPDEDMECWVTVKTTDALYRGSFTKRYGERRYKGFITSGGFMWWSTALAWMPIYEPEPYRPEGEEHE